jgi:hypothetical protein
MTMKFNLAALAVLAVSLSAAPMIASADATTTGSGSTLASPMLTSYHGARRGHHGHYKHHHRRHHAVSAATGT